MRVIKGINKKIVKTQNIDTADFNGVEGELLKDRELQQHFGFKSVPPVGTHLTAIADGNVIIVMAEKNTVSFDLVSGESCLYNSSGSKIILKQNGDIEIAGFVKIGNTLKSLVTDTLLSALESTPMPLNLTTATGMYTPGTFTANQNLTTKKIKSE